ncbi:MAG: CoA-binding protein, partial [Candidatus Aenigmatarchaeota archaeon]
MSELDKFFNPKSVAIIGASHTPGKIGYAILESMKMSFNGKIYPINPNISEIMGLKTYSSVLDIEDQIDLAIIVVKSEIVASVLEECGKKKIRNVIIISSGFSEIGNKKGEDELLNIAKRYKIRIIGPNCIGIYKRNLDMLFMPREKLKRPLDGYLSLITQSGAFGSAILDFCAYNGIGVSKFISIGNRIDVNEIELLEYLNKDVQTRAIGIYLESTVDGKKFIETAKTVVKNKPIVIFKAGKTKKGTEAVASHTGALAGEYSLYQAAFKQAGIIEAKNVEQLIDFTNILAKQPPLQDNKIAIITDGGGFGIAAADAAINAGLSLPEPSPTLSN